ncbi:SAM-dependent DNA methylase [Desulfonema limicola]|uniref:site-specific DNA-methyltransferase (adenine-specific) n=1 Tax=Desulfonema limicola TaxID=45656 RepID=A0A975GH71_9BACT|nr:type ISP restriction/modification enzyme [Desulfonema limicola]QTA80997.1 SAM-dependent DNA methylase [Desulfonema limicola]
MEIHDYINKINARFKTGISTEHSYRGDLQNLLESIAPDVFITNEPSRIACGAPDYIITRENIPVGYIEAKDIGADLKSKAYKEQFDRYRHSLANLIFTDYLDFQLFRDGEPAASISIGQIQGNKITGIPGNYSSFIDLIKEFCAHAGQTIDSASKLSKMMAGKARLLGNVIEKALLTQNTDDQINEQDNTLYDQYKSFKLILIHDITEKTFADVYAQTIAYGMFAARLHDQTLEDFSRQEAARLIPVSNPFLRKLFQYIAGYDLDDRIKWIVDALADIFRAADVANLLKDFKKETRQNDPFIHFYETFLSEYDPALRKSRGVWYTPEPVVNFIVRAVDYILKTDFDLPGGLADTSKTAIKIDVQGKKVKKEVHKVQILDPAAGTGTFLAEVLEHIYKQFEGQQGIWNSYVDEHLIPRLNGFEILMASYAMAHLKLDLMLNQTGYKPKKQQRLRVFLTNSLEEHHPDTGTLFASWLSSEANEANYIKRDTPVMVVLGNPPYSGESSNKGEWIMKLMEDYKKEPGGKEKLKERNPKWINDDYVKFIRYGQYFIERNGTGVLAFINPHGFLDNPTFRGMRWNLLKTFDKIYTIDLHGNSKKKEVCPDGSPDQNVFDIMQGVSINLFVKTGRKKTDKLGRIFHFDLFGKRDFKYDFLFENSLKTVPCKEIPNKPPMYFMVQKDFELEEEYNKGFSVNELFIINSVGIVTARDHFTIHSTKEDVKKTIEEFLSLDDETARTRFNLGKDVRDWKVSFAKKDLENNYPDKGFLSKISYRPFDERWTFYTGKSKGFHCMPRGGVMRHFIEGENVGLIFSRSVVGNYNWQDIQITKNIAEFGIMASRVGNGAPVSPLYCYPETNDKISINQSSKRFPNLKKDIVQEFASKINLEFINEKEECRDRACPVSTFAPIDILDYIYAVLHSPSYRKKYKEFLKIDFPRVPYPKDAETFWKLVKKGAELRQIHLLESPVVEKRITTYPQPGENIIDKPHFENSRVWINQEQYFDNVPQTAWEFYIGGYQPAQKWLKDRKGRKLDFNEILHYQKIITALYETDRIMKKIDEIDFIHKTAICPERTD